MREVMPFVIAGLVSGAVYGLAAVGLVLTYKTSGLFNFAHGAMATVSAYAFYSLTVAVGTSWQVAAVVCVLVVGPVMGLVLEVLARAVARTTLELKIAATVGVLLVIEAGTTLVYGQQQVRVVPVFLPAGDFALGGTRVQWSDAVTIGLAVVVTAALSVALRHTRRGVAMRAVVDDADLLDLAGTSPLSTRRLAWCVGSALAAMSGVLFAPLLPLDPLQLTLLVVQAFGAAAIGRFTSLPLSFTGGLLIGVLASLATRYLTTGLLAGVPSALPFLALFLVLLVLPRRHLVERTRAVQRIRSDWTAPTSLQVGLGVAVIAFLAAVPSFAGIHLTDWTVALATTIVFLSLGLLVRTSGQVSLCHVAFTAIGASAFSHLSVDRGLPWPLALLGCGLVAVPIGAHPRDPGDQAQRPLPGAVDLRLRDRAAGHVLLAGLHVRCHRRGPGRAPSDVPRARWRPVVLYARARAGHGDRRDSSSPSTGAGSAGCCADWPTRRSRCARNGVDRGRHPRARCSACRPSSRRSAARSSAWRRPPCPQTPTNHCCRSPGSP